MSDGEKKWWSWEKWALLIAIIVAVWGVVDARLNKDELIKSQQEIVKAIAAKDLAEQQKVVAETKAGQLKEENAKLGNVSIDRLLALYDAHLSAINKAVSKYDELSKLPDSPDNTPRKEAAEQGLYNEVASFAQFVSKWRDFAATLGKILDGNVEEMEQARERHSPDDVKNTLEVLRKSFPDLRQLLEAQLGKVANG